MNTPYITQTRKQKQNMVWLLLLTWLLFAFPVISEAASQSGPSVRDTELHPYRILCLSSYNYAYPTVPDQLNGLKEGLGALSVDIDFEFMDAKNYYKSADFTAFHDYLAYKIAESDPFDLVVLCDDTAMHFGLNYYEALFDGLPMVFSSVNNQADAAMAATRDYVTGITQVLDFEANLELAHKLFPTRNHLVLIIDNTSTAQGEYTEFQKYLYEHEGDTFSDYTVINASNYSRKGLERAISEVNRGDSLILYLSCLEDGEGHIYSLRTGTALITQNAPDVPIFRLTLSNMGNGVFGGIAYSYYDAGIRTGEIAASILLGANPKDIPVEFNSVTHTYFDQEQLDAYFIRATDLPEDATIINEHPSLHTFYKQNKWLFRMTMFVILLMITIIVILIIVNRQRLRLIHQDFLTQMPNRPYITGRLNSAMDSKTPFGIIMMDIDYFKTINDTMGHKVGDELLADVATRLKAFPTKDILFARIGGDEFMGLIFSANRAKAEHLCQQLVSVMRDDFHLSCGDVSISISAGAAVYPEDTDQPQLLSNYADAALYEVKLNGRDGYRIFRPEYLKNIKRADIDEGRQ